MPNKGAFSDHVDDWDKLLTNVLNNAGELPDLSVYREALAALLVEVKARGARLRTRRGIKQEETRDLREVMRKGRAEAARLRSAIRAHLGFQNPRLLEYGIQPIGGETRPPQEPTSENPAAGEPEKPKPEDPAPVSEAEPAPQKS